MLACCPDPKTFSPDQQMKGMAQQPQVCLLKGVLLGMA
jgi:hypothetical protein